MDSSIELLAQQRLAETGLSPAELLSLDMADYARLTGRPTIGQVAAQAAETAPPGTPRQDPAGVMAAQHPEHSAEDPGIDFRQMTIAEYAQLRGQLGVGRGRQYGVGITNSGAGTADWIAAAQAKGGRHGWQGQNVVESPRIDRPAVRPDVQPDTRSATQRLSNPGTVWGN